MTQESNYPTVAITIVSYGSAEWLPECLGSLQKDIATYPALVDIVLVENKTDADTLTQTKLIAEKYGVRYLPAESNLGFGGGVNYGWQHQTADLYLVLNPDMAFPVGWLKAMVTPFIDAPKVGIVGCKLLDREGKIQHAGGILKYGELLGEHFGAGEPDDGRWDEGVAVDFVTGAALAIRRELKEALGGFDPLYFPGYYEDVDLCWRARQAGWTVYYHPKAVAYHFEGGSFGRSSGYYRAFHRNRLRFALKNLPTERLLHEFLPTERHRLQSLPDGLDRRASEAVYSGSAHNFVSNLKEGDKTPMKRYNLEWEQENQLNARLGERLAEVKKGWLIEEKPFRSKLPFVATLRERFNTISTKWYVKPILQQQIDYNAAVARAIEDLGQLAMSRQADQDLTASVVAGKLEQLENRLARIEALLEQLAQK